LGLWINFVPQPKGRGNSLFTLLKSYSFSSGFSPEPTTTTPKLFPIFAKIFKMTNQELKSSLLQKCIEQQLQGINDLQQQMDDAQQQSNDYGQPKDRYDAFKTKLLRQKDMFGQQQAKGKIVLSTLEQIPLEKPNDKVEFGAVVITNKQKLFVAAGIGKIEMDGQTYFAISPQVPIFSALKGLKKGETTIFNGMKIEIKEVF